MNTKGLLTGNRAIIAQKPYLQGVSRFSCLRPTGKNRPKMGAFRGITVYFSANFQQIGYGQNYS